MLKGFFELSSHLIVKSTDKKNGIMYILLLVVLLFFENFNIIEFESLNLLTVKVFMKGFE